MNTNSNTNADTNASNQTSIPTSTDILVAKLVFIGSTITTIGDGITAIAAALALEALEHPKDQRSQIHGYSSKQLDTTEKQLDLVMSELAQIKSLFK
jgi:hypothetical protein